MPVPPILRSHRHPVWSWCAPHRQHRRSKRFRMAARVVSMTCITSSISAAPIFSSSRVSLRIADIRSKCRASSPILLTSSTPLYWCGPPKAMARKDLLEPLSRHIDIVEETPDEVVLKELAVEQIDGDVHRLVATDPVIERDVFQLEIVPLLRSDAVGSPIDRSLQLL